MMALVGDAVIVRVLKFDGAEYRRWPARIAEQTGSLIVLDAEFDVDVDHRLLGRIRRGTRTVEYYWLDRWYNVFRFISDDGRTRLYYCNVNKPPVFEDNFLTYIDLDIDIIVQPDFSYEILDADEFAANAARYAYPSEVKTEAQRAMDELVEQISLRRFPFDEIALNIPR